MKIVLIDDEGNVTSIKCRKIEPATLREGKIIVDEGEHVIDLRDVMKIVEG